MKAISNTKIAVYGTIRKGQINDRFFSTERKEPVRIPGYIMYNYGGYPGIVWTGNEKDTIVVEPIEVDMKDSHAIDRMEVGAQYYTDVIMIDGEPHKIYLHSPQTVENFYGATATDLIEDGDWLTAEAINQQRREERMRAWEEERRQWQERMEEEKRERRREAYARRKKAKEAKQQALDVEIYNREHARHN